jgi:DNA-binding beta-propeller fold protein YncE
VTLSGTNQFVWFQLIGISPMELKRQATGSGPLGVAVTLDGLKVYVANMGSNNVSVFDAAFGDPILDGGVPRRISVGSHPAYLSFAPDGRRLYVPTP